MAPPLGRLILHIGTAKTGTSALQAFFTANRDALARNRIHYAHTGVGYNLYNHWELMFEFIADYSQVWPIPQDYRRHPGGFTGMCADLKQEIDPLLIAGDTVLLSCEGFFFDIRSADHVKTFLSFFQAWQPTAIVYLRRQEEIVESMSNQLVKSNNWVYSPAAALGLVHQADYWKRLGWWADHLGGDHIVVKTYQRSHFTPEHSLFRDFMDAAGLPFSPEYHEPTGEENSALRSQAGFLIKNDINQLQVPRAEKRQINAAIKGWESSRDDLPRYAILDSATCDKIRQRSADGNRQVAIKYLGREDGTLFPESSDPKNRSATPILEASTEHWDDFLHHLQQHNPDRLYWLAAATQQELIHVRKELQESQETQTALTGRHGEATHRLALLESQLNAWHESRTFRYIVRPLRRIAGIFRPSASGRPPA